MFILLGLIALVILLSISAWISAAEIAITRLSNIRVKKLIVKIPDLADTLFAWLKYPHYLLTVILTINVISDMLITFFSAAIMKQAFYMINRYVVEFAAWIMASFATLIIGEITPKNYARKNPEKTTVFSGHMLAVIDKVSQYCLYPIVKLMEFISDKSHKPSQSLEISKDEMQDIINEGEMSGVIDNETSEMLERNISFSELSVSKIMMPFEEIESVNLNLEDCEFLDRCVDIAHSRIPVWVENRNNIIGYIHIKDILLIWREDKESSLRSLVKPAYFISENKKINELLKEFQSGKTHMAFIKNQDGNIIGMIVLETILEKIVGEIVDEYEI
jgi:putative hemolysin